MIPLLAFVWLSVGSASLHAQVGLSITDDHVDIHVDSELPATGPVALVSYLFALRDPYLPGDVDRLWDSPHGPKSSEARWVAISVDGVSVEAKGWAVPLPAGKRVRARLEARIPERYGGLGLNEGAAMLAAAVPFLVGGEVGSALAVAPPVDWELRYEPLAQAQWLQTPARFFGDPSLFIAGFSRKGYVTLDGEARSPIVRPKGAERPRWGYFGASSDERLLAAYAWIKGALAEMGVAPQRWVMHALRREPSVCGEDALVVSRELFRATPLPQIMDFHRFGLARRAIACALRHAWALSAEDADALAVAKVADLFRRENTTLSSPRDLLRPLSFIPDIDSLIYAPQMPWADVYFMALDEPRSGPEEPDTFFHTRARGKLLFEKLWDRAGADVTRALVAEAVSRKVGISVIANARVPDVWASVLGDVAAGHPIFDASFEARRRSVVVRKDGPGALSHDPIDVQVSDASGKLIHGRAERFVAQDHEHSEAEVVFADATEPLRSVELDPERRLVEYLFRPGEHPRFNNSSAHRIRVVLARLSAAYGSSASEVVAGIDFNVRREYDLHNFFGFGAQYDPLGASVTGRYAYAFGPRITPDHLGYRAGTQLSLERLTQGFVGASEPVYLGTLYAYLNYDDRPSDRTAMRGFAWQLYAALGAPVGRTLFGYAGAAVLKIVPLADGHALAGRLRVGTVIGDAPRQALFTLGGRGNARGFPQTELTRAARITANLEYRHVLARGFRASLFDLVYIDGIEGAAFGDAVLLSDDWRSIFAPQNAFFDVGYGIRFLFDQLGVNPGMMSIDVGVPLKRYDASRPPVSVFVDFVQSFAGL